MYAKNTKQVQFYLHIYEYDNMLLPTFWPNDIYVTFRSSVLKFGDGFARLWKLRYRLYMFPQRVFSVRVVCSLSSGFKIRLFVLHKYYISSLLGAPESVIDANGISRNSADLMV